MRNHASVYKYGSNSYHIDLFDNVYDLVDALTFNMRRVSPAMWRVFELTHTLFKSDAINFLDGKQSQSSL